MSKLTLDEARFLKNCVSTKPMTLLGDDTVRRMAERLVEVLEAIEQVEWADYDEGADVCLWCGNLSPKYGGDGTHHTTCRMYGVDGIMPRIATKQSPNQ